MFPPKKILFPVDFSDRCGVAARMVENFAQRFQAEVTLLQIVEPIAMGYEFSYDAVTPAKERLDTFLLHELSHLPVTRVLLQGDPAHEIVNYAHQGAFDLIMLPTHGYGKFRRFILGSVAAKVLHDAMCPVWTSIHVEELTPLDRIAFKNIVCAVDLGKQSSAALEWAAKFALEAGADLTIAHAMPEGKFIHGFYSNTGWKDNPRREAQEKIEELQQRLSTQAHVSIVPDDVAAGVRGVVEGSSADLLVIGRSVQDGLMGRLRTNAYAIIRQSPCPVVSV